MDTAPVTPKVREVAVTSAPSHAAARQSQPQQASRARADPEPDAPGDEEGRTTPTPRTVESAPQKVTGYATIGVTWAHGVTYAEDQIKIQIRTFKNDAWSTWTKVAVPRRPRPRRRLQRGGVGPGAPRHRRPGDR